MDIGIYYGCWPESVNIIAFYSSTVFSVCTKAFSIQKVEEKGNEILTSVRAPVPMIHRHFLPPGASALSIFFLPSQQFGRLTPMDAVPFFSSLFRKWPGPYLLLGSAFMYQAMGVLIWVPLLFSYSYLPRSIHRARVLYPSPTLQRSSLCLTVVCWFLFHIDSSC